jgi:hypothetical protein
MTVCVCLNMLADVAPAAFEFLPQMQIIDKHIRPSGTQAFVRADIQQKEQQTKRVHHKVLKLQPLEDFRSTSSIQVFIVRDQELVSKMFPTGCSKAFTQRQGNKICASLFLILESGYDAKS